MAKGNELEINPNIKKDTIIEQFRDVMDSDLDETKKHIIIDYLRRIHNNEDILKESELYEKIHELTEDKQKRDQQSVDNYYMFVVEDKFDDAIENIQTTKWFKELADGQKESFKNVTRNIVSIVRSLLKKPQFENYSERQKIEVAETLLRHEVIRTRSLPLIPNASITNMQSDREYIIPPIPDNQP